MKILAHVTFKVCDTDPHGDELWGFKLLFSEDKPGSDAGYILISAPRNEYHYKYRLYEDIVEV